ncbi:MAG: transglycosylase domain-containing protein [Erysipelotrichaceae bacterium]|nr:transglycosylase domain-containing protein [Erysipelotrichaceae bacterium]
MKKFELRKIDWKNLINIKKDPNKPKKPFNIKKVLLNILIVVVALGLIGGIGAAIYIKITIDNAPAFNVEDFDNVESTKIFDADGELVADIGLVSRENVSYEDMPQSLVDAFVSIEDSRFFEHNGFDLPRFVKSLIENIKTLSFSQGASTLTMQLVRNVYFTDDSSQTSRVKSLEYKIQQIYLAIKTEEQLSKKRIFELYINRINFGASTTRGIKGAAEYYFGKDVSELTLSESAYLAGVVNAPNYYNAYKNLEAATERRNTVLSMMLRHGYITQQEYDLAVSIKLEDQLVGVSASTGKYMSYINAVVDEVIELTGQDPYTTTMNIYTYMDKETQETIEAIENGETTIQFPDDLMQVAIVSMNNQTGEIVGIGGGRSDVVAKGFNRATDMYKQPGSSVKPFLSYALAFEYLGWATTHTLDDKPVTYRGTDILLKNFDGTYKGQVLLNYAVGVSLNIPAYLTLQAVVDSIGSAKVVEYLNSLGFTQVTTDNFDLGYAIGGSTFEVTVVQMAAAHSALINGGNYITPHTVSRIEFTDGSDPYVPTYASVSVLSEESAYLATSLMEQDVSVNYGNYMQILKRSYEVYAKTGTTNYDDSFVSYGIPSGAAKDKWMIASTSKYTTAVWIGYDSAVDGEGTYISSAKSALNIPGKINSMLLDVLNDPETTTNVVRPDNVVEITHVKGVYPYASPIDGMNSDLIVTGLINRKFLSLTTLTVPTLSSLTNFTAVVKEIKDGKVTLTLNWSSYPDASQLSLASNVIDISLDITSSDGSTKHVAASGTKLYDPTWVFGIVQYKASVTGLSSDIATSSSQSEVTVSLPSGGSITACGYYAYQNGGTKSNQVCQTVTMDITVPEAASLDSLDEIKAFMTKYGISSSVWTLNPVEITDLSQIDTLYGTVQSVTPDVRGTTVSLANLTTTAVTVNYYGKITVPNFTTKTDAETLMNQLGTSGVWTFTGVGRTSTSQALGGIAGITDTDPRNTVVTIKSIRETALTIKYYVDVQLDLNANTSVADVISFANTYGLTIANETSLTDTTKKVGSLTVGVNTFTSVNKPYLYDLQSPITVTIVP